MLRRSILPVLVLCFAATGQGADDPGGTERDPAGERRLRLYHTHTLQGVDVVYRTGNEYSAEALAQLDDFLKDFRTGEAHPIDPSVFDFLWRLARAVDNPDAVYEIISGYRSPQTNEALRDKSSDVAKRSQHLLGKAIDVRLRGTPTTELRDAALALQVGGVGYYGASDFVHVDTGRLRRW